MHLHCVSAVPWQTTCNSKAGFPSLIQSLFTPKVLQQRLRLPGEKGSLIRKKKGPALSAVTRLFLTLPTLKVLIKILKHGYVFMQNQHGFDPLISQIHTNTARDMLSSLSGAGWKFLAWRSKCVT